MKGDEREFTFFEQFCLPCLVPYINYSTHPSGNPLSRQELTIFTYQETSSHSSVMQKGFCLFLKGKFSVLSHFQIFCLELPCRLLSPGWAIFFLGGYDADLQRVIC